MRLVLRSHLQDVCGNEACQQVVEAQVRVQQLQRRNDQPGCGRRDVCRRDLRLPDCVAVLIQEPAVGKCDAEAGLSQLAPLNDNPDNSKSPAAQHSSPELCHSTSPPCLHETFWHARP